MYHCIICYLDEKQASPEKKVEKSETSSAESETGQSGPGSVPGSGFAPNPFDFSAMSGLLNVCYVMFSSIFSMFSLTDGETKLVEWNSPIFLTSIVYVSYF